MSTYRIQFHQQFTFSDFENIIPYLEKLGIGTIYASPVFEAVPGSTHGYDIVNPLRINPEIGTEEQLRTISRRLRQAGIQWIQDIVPNHMAVHPNNIWLMDVLEKGRYSVYASFFDLAWTSEFFQGRLILPFLGNPLDDVLFNQELQVEYIGQRLVFRYYDSTYPLHPRSYATLLSAEYAPEAIRLLVEQIAALHQIDDALAYTLRWHELLLQVDALMNNTDVRTYIDKRITTINEHTEQLRTILAEQNYKLDAWQKSDEKINFRRFFTITHLIGVNMQHERVFEQYHRLIKTLIDDGIFQGLRVDHIDGLYDPTQYLERLRNLAGEKVYIVVEKILQANETLPAWPIQGTTGYDFLACVNNVLTARGSEEKFSAFYRELLHDDQPTEEKIWDKKAAILHQHMGGERDNLYRYLVELNLVEDAVWKSIDPEDVKNTIAEFLIRCPVYRYYGNRMPLEEKEAAAVHAIFENIRTHNPALVLAADIVEDILLVQPQKGNEEYNESALKFYMRCMQFTGPLMAKGVEDTLMYTYNRFVGHNEVGDSPVFFGMTRDMFHLHMSNRQARWPMTMNATATHDTKRGEDVRTRLNVLTELADDWITAVKEWQEMNACIKQNGMPDANDEYFIYQTLVGAFPFVPEEDIEERMTAYLIKSLREAKRHSQWAAPNEAYEKATTDFIHQLLQTKRRFWKSFEKFQKTVADFGIVHSLIQVLLKFTCPGIPDIYQGCECWDLSLVDPDNRRPVEYTRRMQVLEEIETSQSGDPSDLIDSLWDSRENAHIKLWLTYVLVHERTVSPDLFASGEYIPLAVEGMYKDHILAFARRHKKTWYIVVVPLYLATICAQQRRNPATLNWKDTRVVIPAEAPDIVQNILSGTKGKHPGRLEVKSIFHPFPLAMLKLVSTPKQRKAGILLHITSLPSQFGIGDLGPEAYAFADFLYRSRQTYWQVLPINPTEEANHYSPYSANSSMAGNILLISPELLIGDRLLARQEVESHYLPTDRTVNFAGALKAKEHLLEKAWQVFQQGNHDALQKGFDRFIEREAYWLDDYALYIVLKAQHAQRCWCDWPAAYRQRDAHALKEFSQHHAESIRKEKWLQFIFARQWKRLRAYCASLDIQLFGDLPFYLCYDSADVWSHPEIFSLNEQRGMQAIAGVPPDYFNENGQLWGMPVYNWNELRKSNYEWWIQRIKRNVELFDLIRLDHFRAFAGYWEVPAGEQTAINGQWKKGPGADLFNTLQQSLGSLPFVAEDLGEITEDVDQLREAFQLPGMKVLQFAVSDSISNSLYTPHNYTNTNFIVYTGTHDNNTTRGWYRNDLKRTHQKRLSAYAGIPIRDNNVHTAMIRLAYSSVARTAIIPMQDILGAGEETRMNIPGSTAANWLWRLQPGKITPAMEEELRTLVVLYNRG
ncbi:malto-oligosyltrehalose synthase [Ohtaekwangia sp.]|uniref:malto-oligosyltrehalose synthase n=1 Tax=Ohtaekwangia sp. TaxID=2066019 RepID=UPI002F94AF30